MYILNPWRAVKDCRRIERRARGEPSVVDTDAEASTSKRMRKKRIKVNEPTIEAVAARPFNPNIPLKISEPTKGVIVTSLPTAQVIFRDIGEAVLFLMKRPESLNLVKAFSIFPFRKIMQRVRTWRKEAGAQPSKSNQQPLDNQAK